jgi:LDH2 family malate/lactate/ureidoglycolate dehydrogenase
LVGWFAVQAAVDIAKNGIAGLLYTDDYDVAPRQHGMLLCIMSTMTNTSAMIVVPTHSNEACSLGTNPISLAAPCSSSCQAALSRRPHWHGNDDNCPLIGRVESVPTTGQQNVNMTPTAKPCTNPNEIIDHGGAMLPLGGASEVDGWTQGLLRCALMMVELLCGVFAGTADNINLARTLNMTM